MNTTAIVATDCDNDAPPRSHKHAGAILAAHFDHGPRCLAHLAAGAYLSYIAEGFDE